MKIRFLLLLRAACITCLALVFVLAFAQPSASAQGDDSSGPPSEPLLGPAPDFSEWVVTFTYPEDQSASGTTRAETRPRTITTTKTLGVVREEIVSGTGQKQEIWHVRDLQYNYVEEAKVWLQPTLKADNGYDPLPPNGFRGLDWIAMNNFIGRIKSSAGSYLVFSPVATHKLAQGAQFDQVKSLETYALIDEQTRLPAMAQLNWITRVYRFDTPPTEKLSLPQDLQQILKKLQDTRDRLSQPTSRPY